MNEVAYRLQNKQHKIAALVAFNEYVGTHSYTRHLGTRVNRKSIKIKREADLVEYVKRFKFGKL